MKYVMLITYSWDSDYVAVPCETEREAIDWLTKYLDDELGVIRDENEYEPIVKRYSDGLVDLMYEEDEIFVDSATDIATYRVIEIGYGFKKEYWKE